MAKKLIDLSESEIQKIINDKNHIPVARVVKALIQKAFDEGEESASEVNWKERPLKR
jgi:hypothetical protein